MEVKCVAVIGAGTMGRGIAYLAARARYKTILEDASSTRLEQAIAWIQQTLRQAKTQANITGNAGDATFQNLSTADTVETALREADLIIETLPEEMEMKIEIFTIFDKFAKPGAIFASTTATFPVADLAEVTFCADRCIGMRFSSPVEEAGLLELVKAPETSEETTAACAEVARRMKKKVHVVLEPRP